MDQKRKCSALLADLSKAFDFLTHYLAISKLYAYGFSIGSLILKNGYLTEREQKFKMNGQFSLWMHILVVVPQGSILGPLLLNIFLYICT